MNEITDTSAAAGPAEPVGVVGVGWVGLVTAACFAEQGHEVWAMDIDAAKIASLAAGELTIHEPDLPELVRRNAERLHFTTEMDELLANVRLIFCCVDTPPTYSGDADLSRVKRGRRAVQRRLRARAGDEEHGPVRDRRGDPPRPARSLLRLLPRVPQGGHGGRATSSTPTAS